MALLKTIVFPYVMQVITADDNRTHHFHLLHHSGQNTATDGNIAGERTLLVNVSPFNSLNTYKIMKRLAGRK